MNKRSLLSIKKLYLKKEILEKKNTITKLRNSMKNNSRLEKAEKLMNLKTNYLRFSSQRSQRKNKPEESWICVTWTTFYISKPRTQNCFFSINRKGQACSINNLWVLRCNSQDIFLNIKRNYALKWLYTMPKLSASYEAEGDCKYLESSDFY